jgi:hypothetical protein
MGVCSLCPIGDPCSHRWISVKGRLDRPLIEYFDGALNGEIVTIGLPVYAGEHLTGHLDITFEVQRDDADVTFVSYRIGTLVSAIGGRELGILGAETKRYDIMLEVYDQLVPLMRSQHCTECGKLASEFMASLDFRYNSLLVAYAGRDVIVCPVCSDPATDDSDLCPDI